MPPIQTRVEQNGWMAVPQFGGWDQKAAATNYSMVFQQARANRKQKKSDFSGLSIGNDHELVTHPQQQPAPTRRRGFRSYFTCCMRP